MDRAIFLSAKMPIIYEEFLRDTATCAEVKGTYRLPFRIERNELFGARRTRTCNIVAEVFNVETARDPLQRYGFQLKFDEVNRLAFLSQGIALFTV